MVYQIIVTASPGTRKSVRRGRMGSPKPLRSITIAIGNNTTCSVCGVLFCQDNKKNISHETFACHYREGLNPARCIPSCASGFSINTFQMYPVRAFSAINNVIPRSIPTTSVSYQFLIGFTASTNP